MVLTSCDQQAKSLDNLVPNNTNTILKLGIILTFCCFLIKLVPSSELPV